MYNTYVNNGLWVIMMCQCMFINCNKCTALVGDVDNGKSFACMGAGGIWEISMFSYQFCCESQTALKKSCLFKIKIEMEC